MVVLARWPENLVVTLLSLHQPVGAAQLSGGPQVLSLLLRAWPLASLLLLWLLFLQAGCPGLGHASYLLSGRTQAGLRLWSGASGEKWERRWIYAP